MNTLPKWLKKTLHVARKNWFTVFAIATYIFFTSFYLGPAVFNCGDSIYGFGDSTAGPIWKNSLEPKQPILGGFQTSTNFPTGESLYSPVGYASLVQSTVMNITSSVVGPVCSYNLYNIFGYLTTSVMMFAFILYLTRSRWIALLAGYAVAFTPYVQSKIGGHPSYGYASLLIALLWLTIHLITYRKKVHAVLLAVVLGLCAYFDPYFILLAITIVVPVGVIWGLIGLRKRKMKLSMITRRQLIQWAKPFVICAIVFAVLVAPLLIVRIKDSDAINSTVSSVRGNVLPAAMLCSNTPIDYLLPDPYNIHLVGLLGPQYISANTKIRHWCGPGESRVSLSLALLAIVALGVIIGLWERLNKRRLGLSKLLAYNPRLIIGSVVAIGIVAVLFGLPPYINGFITPTGVILKITETWRIFAREYVVVNIALVVLSAIALSYFASLGFLKRRRIIKAILYGLVFVAIMCEYQINSPFSPPVFSYSRDVPQVYRYIQNDSAIDVIAEYPMDRMGLEHDSVVYYMTMQAVHGKKLFNNTVVGGISDIHVSMRDLADPQTIPALRSLGIKYVVVHGEKKEELLTKIPGLVILVQDSPEVYALTMVREDKEHDIILVKLPDGPSSSNILTFDSGYVTNLVLLQSPINTEFEIEQQAVLSARSLKSEIGTSVESCFAIRMSNPGDVANVTIKMGENEERQLRLDVTYQSVRLSGVSGDKITIKNDTGAHMRLDKLGCL